MGREVRMVPPDWEHPKDDRGRFIPMHDEDYGPRARRWLDDAIAWDNGTHPDLVEDPERKTECPFFWMWDGDPPREDCYRPAFTSSPTHYMMYESTSEGTPISPAFATPEELARWLADTGASTFADMTATYNQWLSMIRRGSAPSAVFTPETGLVSGVEGLHPNCAVREEPKP